MEAIEFSNPYFCRAQPHLLRRIKRKDTSKPSANQKATQNQVQELMIRLQEHQEETFTRFERITDENEGYQPFNFDLIYSFAEFAVLQKHVLLEIKIYFYV